MIYLVYKDGVLLFPTTLPRIVQDAFKDGADKVELWRGEKLVRATSSLTAFNKIINPPANEDTEQGGEEYEW